MTTTIPASVYRDAAAILDQRGWLQGAREEEKGGPVDITGALAVALGLDPYAETEELAAATGFVAFQLGEEDLSDWNDDTARTEDEARRALISAADVIELAAL
jgi:hypothetical protein